MAMADPIPSSNSNHFQTYSLNIKEISSNPHREVSFSSYLNPAEEALIHKLVQPGSGLSFNSEHVGEHFFDFGIKDEEGEIGVFEAEKYFNGEIDPDHESPKMVAPSKNLIRFDEPEEEEVIEPIKPRSRLRTRAAPSLRSESSLNSQSALLQNITTGIPSRKRGSRRSLLSAIATGCRCSCSDKGSVDVVDDVNIADSFSTSVNGKPGSGSFGALHAHGSGANAVADPRLSEEIQALKSWKFGNPGRKNFSNLPPRSMKPSGGEEANKPRKSLEVFGSPPSLTEKNSREGFGMEKRLNMVTTWDGNPRKEADADGTESDVSSELFEIESLTGKVTSYLTTVATSDCPTPTTARYAPSEASIEWSVVTASAADFSVTSDSEETTSRGRDCSLLAKKGGANGDAARTRRRPVPAILLGCKSQKAVEVAEEIYHRTSSERFGLDARTESGRRSNKAANLVEAKLMGLDPRHLFYVGK
ncbi:hypothetical protein SAY86_019860 [Trapa natans]|uniref:Protein PHYTOCHROME KINASE SUBSTRATE 1-like n=1 Tax=Trapa natans TaxID=22666 RepID=A0AAN7M1R4_TRANT|nr:hypothetical protein SAY86_019860 [Trapa natans]